ncbi:hypothetical protein ACFC4G_46495 [Streptomyces sp. NPDC056002]|uniref:hypothetical protein n=1 Tax=Streptomyces sp. NPDC056002 TaxID=3345675 RepID=UPI0035DCB53A
MTLHASWQVRCAVCDKVAEPTGRGTVDIDHDLEKHEDTRWPHATMPDGLYPHHETAGKNRPTR